MVNFLKCCQNFSGRLLDVLHDVPNFLYAKHINVMFPFLLDNSKLIYQ